MIDLNGFRIYLATFVGAFFILFVLLGAFFIARRIRTACLKNGCGDYSWVIYLWLALYLVLFLGHPWDTVRAFAEQREIGWVQAMRSVAHSGFWLTVYFFLRRIT